MDPRDRLGGVLRELRELGIDELFLDGMTAEEASRLLAARGASTPTSAQATPARSTASNAPRTARAAAGGPREAFRKAAGAPAFPGPPEPKGDRAPLQVLAAEASTCPRCAELVATRTQVVFGRGNPAADLVVVGEAPGGEEDRRGLPFVGPAGKMLDLLLLAAGFPRDDVYICNVLKCRPPGNRDPQADEVANCSPWLHRQLELIRPKVLLAVGKFAGQMLSGSDASISRLRGVVHSYRDIPVVATYHPADLLRSPHATRGTWQDFQLMRRVLDEHD